MELLFEIFTFFNMFHVQLFTAELIICIHLKRKKYFNFMMFLGAIYLIVPYAFFDFYFWRGFVYLDWFTIGFMVLMLISVFLIYFTFEVHSKKELIFYISAANILQHLIHSLSESFFAILNINSSNMQAFLGFTVSIVMYILFYFVFVSKIKRGDVLGVKNSFLLIFITFSMFIVYFLSLWINSVEGGTIGSYLLDVFCTMLLLIIQFGMFERNQLERENEIMNQILRLSEDKKSKYIENIELINIKCHDLKYQIQMLREIDNIGEKDKGLKEIERAIMFYDMSAKTGNETLDIIIAERTLLFDKYNIRFSCIADGEKLDFMSHSDLYILFGNALDNAIESLRLIVDEEKRIINLNITSKGNNLIVNLKNSYFHEITFKDGMPETTKENNGYHGYGMRSMKYLVEKYNGTLVISTKDNLFVVNMLFQLK